MEKIRADGNTAESGIALVTALVITVVVMMLIASLTYLFTKGFQTNIINRKFSTVYEAANGGVEYTAGIINIIPSKGVPGDLGNVTPSTTILEAIVKNCDQTNTTTITARTADGNYQITTTLSCLGTSIPPGAGGLRRFPPPPSKSGGGTAGGQESSIYYYSIISRATETANSQNVGQTEAIYRVVQ